MTRRRNKALLSTGALAIALTLFGCAAGTNEPAATEPTPTPTAVATTDASAQLTEDELAKIFTGIQFVPAQYSTVNELIDSIYPGLAAADLSCLSPFGVGWDSAADGDSDSAIVEFGTSNDRSMTAVVSSTGTVDAATSLLAATRDSLAACADKSGIFTMQGAPVATTVEETTSTLTGTDDAVAWRVSGTVAGAPFTLVGVTAQVGGNAIALVGWDPSTNEKNVPLATQMFVDKL